jgi:hypothetical protein
MTLDREVAEHVLYRLHAATIHTYPFPHFFATEVFPTDYYKHLLDDLPLDPKYAPSPARSYQGRRFANPLEIEGLGEFSAQWFMSGVMHKFAPWVTKRFKDAEVRIATDLRLVRDQKAYFIGPHTDAPWKLISLLFYLPPDAKLRKHGTSLYVPVDPAFECPGGPHHEFEDFVRVHTFPFIPNSCVGFWKTSRSFHGVEPIDEPVQRDVLLWNAYDAAQQRVAPGDTEDGR